MAVWILGPSTWLCKRCATMADRVQTTCRVPQLFAEHLHGAAAVAAQLKLAKQAASTHLSTAMLTNTSTIEPAIGAHQLAWQQQLSAQSWAVQLQQTVRALALWPP